MPKTKKQNKPAVAKTRKIAKSKKDELVFAGANHFMDKDKLTPAQAMAQKVQVLVSRALNIPVLSVVIMGNMPYVNNHGRKEKMDQYAPGAQFEYDYVQIAKDDTEKAICKARIIDAKGKPLCGWIIGECSPATTRMSTLKGYQNHMAQTRAENRAFEATYGARFRKDLFTGVAEILKKEAVGAGTDTEELSTRALQAGRTSAEEAVLDPSFDRSFKDPEMEKRRTAYTKALKIIATTRDIKQLERAKGNIATSDLYERPQKNELIKMIDARIQELKA